MAVKFLESTCLCIVAEYSKQSGVNMSDFLICQVTAEDDDADENRLLRYTIMSVAPDTTGSGIGGFEMDVNTGTVRTTGSFNREMFAGPYSITVSVACQITIPPSHPPSFPPLLPLSLHLSPDIGARQWNSSSQWQHQTSRLSHRYQ